MKASEVLRVLHVTRPTLTKYVKEGLIKVTQLPNGRYLYDDNSVYAFLNNGRVRETIIYARVNEDSSVKEAKAQVAQLQAFAKKEGYEVTGVYFDICDATLHKKKSDLFKVLEAVMNDKVGRIISLYPTRLSRVAYNIIEFICRQHNCELVFAENVPDKKFDMQSVKAETIALLTDAYCEDAAKPIVAMLNNLDLNGGETNGS